MTREKINEKATELALSWENGNRNHVIATLATIKSRRTALAIAVLIPTLIHHYTDAGLFLQRLVMEAE